MRKSEQSQSAAVAVAEEIPPPPAPVIPSVQSAMSIARQRLANNKADEAEWRSKATRIYFELLLRSDNPRPGDGEDLALVVADLGISPGQLEADGDLVQRAKIYTEWVSQGDDANAKCIALRPERIALERRQKEEMREMHRKISHEEGRVHTAVDGQGRLNVLARQRPEFFDHSNPAASRLLSSIEDAAGPQPRVA